MEKKGKIVRMTSGLNQWREHAVNVHHSDKKKKSPITAKTRGTWKSITTIPSLAGSLHRKTN